MDIEQYATKLADAIDDAIPEWIERCIVTVAPELTTEAHDAAMHVQAETGKEIRRLLEADIDEQWTTPLALLRAATNLPTKILQAAGAEPVARDGFARNQFPDDLYDLAPANYGDVTPSLVEPAIEWGAAKAFVHKARHAPRDPK